MLQIIVRFDVFYDYKSIDSILKAPEAVLLSCFLLCSVRGQRSGEENLFGGDVGLNRCNPDSAHSEDDVSNWGLAREQSGATKLLTIILSCQEAGAPAGGRDYDGSNPKHIRAAQSMKRHSRHSSGSTSGAHRGL